MSWTLGKVTIPQAPSKVSKKTTASLKKIPFLVAYPWVMSMGADVTELQIEGEAIGEINETLYTSYLRKLEKYTKQDMTVDEVLLDDSFDVGVWTNSDASTFKNTGVQHVKGENSVNVVWGANDHKVYRDFATNKDFEHHNFASIWMKGETSKSFKITFYNEAFASKANGYRFYANCETAWTQTFVGRSSGDNTVYISNTVGTPTGWDKIRSIVIEPSTSVTAGAAYYIDAFYLGHGWKLEAPGTRYDGIYAINTFQVDESKGEVRSLTYKLTLLDKTPFFGET